MSREYGKSEIIRLIFEIKGLQLIFPSFFDSRYLFIIFLNSI